ncbi:hypothetical protein CDL12_24972 [Handroanthus impetiginosus]|uniref:DUF4228 domain-containing protein n=1 Tax=Handroanthus impetiginosus TaxID=429701 RepID=A0A2G9GC07_9LAMI|nr:hypothetical protein CDL12_24972 [Handroanthus impetiginosus]
MGNCLVLQEKVVRVMKTDGKILEYKFPIKAHQVLSEFSHHAISDKLPVLKYLHPNDELRQGHLYYLLPLPVPTKNKNKKKNTKKKTVRFSDDVRDEPDRGTGVVRIKVLIKKQELEAILSGGGVSIGDLVSKVQNEESSKEWFPALESIHEVN